MSEINPKLLYRNIFDAIEHENIEDLLNEIVIAAINRSTSDIHIEPFEENVRLRFRVDGMLEVILRYPSRLHSALVSRFKILSGLKIDEKRIPQDGRVQFDIKGKDGKPYYADLRVSTLPTIHGEKIVMRLASRASDVPSYDKLGFRGNNLKYIQEAIKAPNGIIVVSGPTGSGKTVTLYSTLKLLNNDDTNIMTIEDPVELELEGLSQCQTNAKVGLTFDAGLRAALRQDPDKIMIGEIRDLETAEVAIHAALTGHLVLSTIHTNSAAETINRFDNMGVAKYLIASSLRTVIAQRLIRRICPNCKKECPISKDVFEDIQKVINSLHPTEELDPALLSNLKLYKGEGCAKCAGTGYKGRIGIYEILMIQGRVIDAILKGLTVQECEKVAMEEGMCSLRQDGIIKVLEGYTTIDEVYRVCNSH